jgi:zinc transporter ZupT
MAKPKGVLSLEDYENYRIVRASAVLFVLVGGFHVYFGIAVAAAQRPDPEQGIPLDIAVGIAIFGLAGVVGGITALLGNRRWAKVAYVMAVPYLLGFPLGTYISYKVLSGLSRYLDSKERIRQARIGGA